ncbi:MAG: hypothetical protein H0T51_11565 [Pirellulales bacterium]|nr:hypothetical protein [Pirellulales bacterium]
MATNLNDQLEPLEAAQRRELDLALQQISTVKDPLFRDLAFTRTQQLLAEAKSLAGGELVFMNTETWRAAYEKLLLELDFSTYFSVAWVRTSDYWRDQAGRRSIRLNYELLDRGLQIERILILPETLWPPQPTAPSDSISTWLQEQHYRGIKLSLARQPDLIREPDLISDFGIYGDRAAGEQELDDHSRTIRFRLAFGEAAARRARQRWDRLTVFSVPCSQVLDLN